MGEVKKDFIKEDEKENFFYNNVELYKAHDCHFKIIQLKVNFKIMQISLILLCVKLNKSLFISV